MMKLLVLGHYSDVDEAIKQFVFFSLEGHKA